MAKPNKNPIFNVAAWGNHYVDLLLNVCIPSLLSENNLPVYSDGKASFEIYTTRKDKIKIKSHESYKALQRIMKVILIYDDNVNPNDHFKYHVLTGFHIHVMKEAYEQNRPVVFLSPDTCWSDGSVRTIKKAIKSGKRALMIGAPRIEYESFTNAVNQEFPLNRAQVRHMPSRELVASSLRHMHDYTRTLYWDCPHFNQSIAHYLFDVPGEGVLSRFFILHPLMVWAKRPVKEMTYTIDVDLIPLAVDHYEELAIVKDSDDLFAIELSKSDDPNPSKLVKRNGSMIMWSKHQNPEFPDDLDLKAISAAVHCKHNYDNPFHRRFMHESIRYHTGGNSEKWQQQEQRADKITRMVDDCMDRDPSKLFLKFCGPKIEGKVLAGAGPRW